MTFNPREQSLIDSLNNRLSAADFLTTENILKELEESTQYNTPSHTDHIAFLHMRPLIIGRQMELEGRDPLASGNDAASSMLDNQRFYGPPQASKEPDFSQEDHAYTMQKKDTQAYLDKLASGEVKVSDEDRPVYIQEAKKQLVKLDEEHEADIKARDAELSRIDGLESQWLEDRAAKSSEMKREFMETRLRGVLKIDAPRVKELAEKEWSNLADAYGF